MVIYLFVKVIQKKKVEEVLLLALSLSNVTKNFGEHTAVNQLNLEIPNQELFGFLGGNGAGKTTTFRMILGLIDQTEGNITWNGERINYDQSHLIGYLPEERGLYPKLRVKEQLLYLGKLRGMTKQEALIQLNKWLERFRVESYLNKRVEELSKGNQQKIQFISSVIHQPKLLILDEPFSGLDPINVEMMKEAVLDLTESGTTIVFSSHQMDDVEQMCENVCILRKGNAVVKGNLKDIKKTFGRKNLQISADFNLDFVEEMDGVLNYKRYNNGCKLQIANEQISQTILHRIQQKGFIRKFELEEPSLHDIFIEKVGEQYE